MDFVVYLNRLELLKVKGYGIKSSVITLLQQDSTESEVRSVSLDNGGLGRVEVI